MEVDHNSEDELELLKFTEDEEELYKYRYELIKRIGWRERCVESKKYLGSGLWQRKLSISISLKNFDDRRKQHFRSGKQPLEIPIAFLQKTEMIDNFDASDASGVSLQLVPRMYSNLITSQVLYGCILKYQEEQKKYRQLGIFNDGKSENQIALEIERRGEIFKHYPKLYPDREIKLPSPRLAEMITLVLIEGDTYYKSINEMKEDFTKILEACQFSRGELEIWETYCEIDELLILLMTMTNKWILYLRADPLSAFGIQGSIDEGTKNGVYTDEENGQEATTRTARHFSNHLILKIKYTYKDKLGTFGFRREGQISRVVLSIMLNSLLAIPFANQLIKSKNCYVMFVAGIVFVFTGLLFYILLSDGFVSGARNFFGLVYQPNIRIGSAETDHITFEPPDGTVFAPPPWRFQRDYPISLEQPRHKRLQRLLCLPILWLKKKLKGGYCDPVVIAYYKLEQDDDSKPLATATASCTPEIVTIRARKDWNKYDPWGIVPDSTNESESSGSDIARTEEKGRMYRDIAYSRFEYVSYTMLTLLKPKNGKRNFGYTIAPLIALLALFIVQFYIFGTPSEQNTSSIIVGSIVSTHTDRQHQSIVS
ncbi:MAG: hypothetical protein FWD45_00725, partial [Coriobacteriia bacterium]|nr:hypothetical protein [Coriobacteriia bacterium]